MVVQDDVAKLPVAAGIVRVRQRDAVFRAGLVDRRAAGGTVQLTLGVARADLLAAHLDLGPDRVRLVPVDAAGHDDGRRRGRCGRGTGSGMVVR